ncbi:MAG TPA: MFS transporter [Smithellaceae bacterium]|jgi:MFS family permease|nr:MFS transporter [Smithellaceae bacterium]
MSDNQEKNDRSFGSGGRHARIILIVCTLLYMVNYMDRQVLSVVLEPMKADLGLTDAQAGMLQTIFFLSMAVLAFPISFSIDRWSRRKSVAVMAIIWSAATYLTGLGKSFLGVLFPRIFVGVGEAGFSAGGTAWVTAAYPPESRGKALGVFNVAIPIGAALGVVLGGYLSANFGGWRTPFFVFAIPGVVLGIIAFFLPDYRTMKGENTKGASKRSVVADTLELWRIPSLKWVFVGYGLRNIMSFSILVWSPALLMRTMKISESKAGAILGVMGLVAILGALIGGVLADAWKKRGGGGRVMVAGVADTLSAMLGVGALIILGIAGEGASFGNPLVIASLILLTAYFISSVVGTPATGAVTQDVVEPRLKGISWGMTMFCMYMLGGAWGPVLTGALSDRLGGGANGLRMALIFAAATGVLGAFCFWRSSRHYAADCAKVAHCTIEAEK